MLTYATINKPLKYDPIFFVFSCIKCTIFACKIWRSELSELSVVVI